MGKELSQYLQQLAREGERDSQGFFSVDYSKALDKLSTRLFNDPCSYLLKLVQAALASGAGEVDVQTHRDRLEVHFTSSTFSSEQMADLANLLHEPLGREEDRAMAHFLRALHAGRALRPQSLAWAIRAQRGGVGYLFQGEEMQTQALFSRPEEGAECVFSIRKPSSNKSHWADEQIALSTRCLLTPKAIRWDNRALNPGIPKLPSRPLLDRIFLSQQPGRELLALPHLTELKALVYDLGNGYKDHYSYGDTILHQWRGYRPRAEHNLFVPPSSPDFTMVESDVIQEVFGIPKGTYAVNHGAIRPGRLEGSNNGYQILYVYEMDRYTRTPFLTSQGRFGKLFSPCAQAWMRCPAQPDGPSQLYLLQDGVLLDPVEISLGLAGARVFVADHQAKTDLSGLTPVHDDRLKRMQIWLQEEAGRSKKELRKTLRWSDKYGLSQAWVDQVYQIHSLDRDD